jgi:hypothetical protein
VLDSFDLTSFALVLKFHRFCLGFLTRKRETVYCNYICDTLVIVA